MNAGGINIILTIVAFSFVVGCTGPSFVDKANGDETATNTFSDRVLFHVHDAYKEKPPGCVAILPFETPNGSESNSKNISLDQTQTVRRALYAHLSPQGKRDVEIPRVDFVISQLSVADLDNYAVIGEQLGCDAVIAGNITEYGSNYFGIYSKVAVGADLKMFRAVNGTLLWEGEHVATSHGGEIPFSPFGLAAGIVKAATNLNEEQILRVVDDLTRRLVSTIPDNRIAILEEPLSPIQLAVRKKPADAKTAKEFLAALKDTPREGQEAAMSAAIDAGHFKDGGNRELYEALIALAPDNAEPHARYARYLVDQGDYQSALRRLDTSLDLNSRVPDTHFVKARTLIKLNDLKGADEAIIEAISLDSSNPKYFNALGYVNSLSGNTDRALAAYRMTLNRDPANGFAYYNIGVILLDQGDPENAADAFYGAGLAYLKTGYYGQANKVLLDLKDLASQGGDLNEEIQTLENALKRTTSEGKSDV